jgi:hypothetical protein
MAISTFIGLFVRKGLSKHNFVQALRGEEEEENLQLKDWTWLLDRGYL